ncbi:reverse transcriptase [Stylonychia lemnae]|uniref:Reverse transcriptase n=1 Tax=Stylonychia lemnae TaxID=5949 RepID=A0A078ANZ2_STYLE|nr:reverse transcriptase [Stylonychia lemnae]|eukprot:CDW82678.1 reverse transcriptase [Stylonychia lemnae]
MQQYQNEQIFENIRLQIIQNHRVYSSRHDKLLEDYSKIKNAVAEALKNTSIKKAYGNDLISPNIKKQSINVEECQCPQAQEDKIRKITTRKILEQDFDEYDNYLEIQCEHYNQREKVNPIKKKIQIFNVIVERLSIIIMNGDIPTYMMNCKIVPFSKSGSTIIQDIKQIRPIGVLPIFYKVIEKAYKILLDRNFEKILQTNYEQAGFTKNRSTLDHTSFLLQRLSQDQITKDRIFVLCDITSAYDNVNHNIMLNIMKRRTFALWNSEPIVENFYALLEKSYSCTSASIGDNTFTISQGLIQGSALSPDLFKIYLQDMLNESQDVISTGAENYSLLCQKHQQGNRENMIRNVHYNSNMTLLFADDILAEFNNLDHFKLWYNDTYRQQTWNKYNMQLNDKTVIISKNPLGSRLIEMQDGNKFKIASTTKYLGIKITRNSFRKNSTAKAQALKAEISDKMQRLMQFQKKYLPITNYRTQQIYLDSIYRYYITPFVLTNNISIQDALEIWRLMSKKLLGVPQRVNGNLAFALTPQPNLVLWWFQQAQSLYRRIPFQQGHEVINEIVKNLDTANQMKYIDKTLSYQEIAQQIEAGTQPKYYSLSLNMVEDYYMNEIDKMPTPEEQCPLCLTLRTIPDMHITKAILQYKSEQNIKPEIDRNIGYIPIECKNVAIFTDAGYNKIGNVEHASIGIVDFLNPTYMAYEVSKTQHGVKLNTKLNNVVGELLAIQKTIDYIIKRYRDKGLGDNKKKNIQVQFDKSLFTIYTDSLISVDILQRWIYKWTNGSGNLNCENAHLIVDIHQQLNKYQNIQLKHVRAHQKKEDWKSVGNHYADRAATFALTHMWLNPRCKMIVPEIEDDGVQSSLCKNCLKLWNRESTDNKKSMRKTMKQQLTISSEDELKEHEIDDLMEKYNTIENMNVISGNEIRWQDQAIIQKEYKFFRFYKEEHVYRHALKKKLAKNFQFQNEFRYQQIR